MRIPADPTIPDVVRVLRDMEKRMDYIQGIAVAPQLRGPMDANGQRILNVADPVSDRDAVNKKRGDADYAPKAAYYVTTQGDGTLTNEKVLTAGSGISVTVGGSTVTVAATGAGTGDVVGPASAVDSNFAAFDTTTGKLIKDSGSAASSFATAAHTQTAAAGGTGIDTSASTGVPLVTAGTWSVLSTTGTGNVVRATSPTITTPTMSSPTISDRLLVVSGGSITLPNSTTSMVGTDTAQVITSKSFVDGASCTFVDNGDNTKKLAFECSGITTGTTRTLTVPNASGTIALTADLASYQPLDADLTSWAAVTRAAGFDTFAATPSSANLAALISDETGSGALVFATSPTLVGATLSGNLLASGSGTIDIGDTTNPFQGVYVSGGSSGAVDGAVYLRPAATTSSDRLYGTSNLGVAFSILQGTDNVWLQVTGSSASGSIQARLGVADATQEFTVKDSAGTDRFAVTGAGGATIASTTSLAQQLLTLDQNDTDQSFIDFQGNTGANATASVSTWTAGNTIQGFVQVEINGTKRWIPYYNDPTS